MAMSISKEVVMTEKTEWEVIDDREQPSERPTIQQFLRAALGRYWRWKLAGLFIVTAIILVILVAFVGVIALVLSATAIVLLAAAKLRRWLQRGSDTRVPKNPGS